MVDIVVGAIPPVQNNQGKNEQQRRPPGKKGVREKRKGKVDRRRSVRDGIVVTLSDRVERRQQPDRRKEPA